MTDPGQILLVSCYEPGHQPLTVASAVAFLRRAGYAPVCLDLAVEPLDASALDRIRRAVLVCISVPMHTALRLGLDVARVVGQVSPGTPVCFFGLYAPLNAELLTGAGAVAVLGGEAEEGLVALADALREGRPLPPVPDRLHRPAYLPPERDGLPAPGRYARLLVDGERRVAGHVEASRGCKHVCRHCPIPPVYGGRFFAVPAEVVLEDARRQIAAGAQHITFGDPDFLNGPRHAMTVARELHAEHPAVTFDFTAKVEHLLAHRDLLPELVRLGAVFVVSAFESMSDEVLRILDKGHTRADALAALDLARGAGLSLRPTFIPFTPWSTLDDYADLVELMAARGLEHQVDPIQMAIRLLLPPGSLLLGRPELSPFLGSLDGEALTHRWSHPDPRMDALHREVTGIVEDAARGGQGQGQDPCDDPWLTHQRIAAVAARAAERPPPARTRARSAPPPRLSEPWFCCAEPTKDQLGSVRLGPR